MLDKALYTACSDKFFPSIINLLGSIKSNYPEHPKIFIYDLGLSWPFRKELQSIENVELVPMPHFCPFWRACYTWKSYIFQNPRARLNFYMDAGNQVLRSLDEIFSFVEKDDYFFVEQGPLLKDSVPEEYRYLFPIKQQYYESPTTTAGLVGFKTSSIISRTMEELHKAALAGLALGFSPAEQWRNKGYNKAVFIRNCTLFRHDTSLLSAILRKNLGDYILHNVDKYGGYKTTHDHPGQLIWNFRMNFVSLSYIDIPFLHKNPSLLIALNRFYIRIFLFARKLNFKLKRIKLNHN